ncbi:hypothetical protein BDW62DRAFT_171345 [Aspergillus aurantiobrunneus]
MEPVCRRAEGPPCGSSPAIVSSISVGTAVVGCLIALGLKRFKSGIPVASSCSLAIAAACFVEPDRCPSGPGQSGNPCKDMECLPLQWGVVSVNDGFVGHCGFASDEVTMPLRGRVYR